MQLAPLSVPRGSANPLPVFTGIVEDIGRLLSRTSRGPGARFRVGTSLGPLVLGESISVMGVCLTVHRGFDGAFEADASEETLARTTLGRLRVGHQLNLERAVAMGGRFGGHIVTGHVDGVGRLLKRRNVGDAVELSIGFDEDLSVYLAEKGSIAVDGVSLTVNAVDSGVFRVTIVPHTQDKTLFGDMAIGAEMNLEVDVLARYVARCVGVDRARGRGSSSVSSSVSSSGTPFEGSSRKSEGGSSDGGLMSRLAKAGFLL